MIYSQMGQNHCDHTFMHDPLLTSRCKNQWKNQRAMVHSLYVLDVSKWTKQTYSTCLWLFMAILHLKIGQKMIKLR